MFSFYLTRELEKKCYYCNGLSKKFLIFLQAIDLELHACLHPDANFITSWESTHTIRTERHSGNEKKINGDIIRTHDRSLVRN